MEITVGVQSPIPGNYTHKLIKFERTLLPSYCISAPLWARSWGRGCYLETPYPQQSSWPAPRAVLHLPPTSEAPKHHPSREPAQGRKPGKLAV